MTYNVIWYGKAGVVDKTPFNSEKDAKDHAIAEFPTRKKGNGVVVVEVRDDEDNVVFTHSGS
jgi:hypothetical protein